MKKNKTVANALLEGKRRLQLAGKDNFAFEAELLLMEVCKMSRIQLFTQGEIPISLEEESDYNDYLKQRELNRPLQYILGQCEFMGLPFCVGEGVLIPRGDTELLVETVLSISKENNIQRVIDLGTGSGCIPICLSHYGKLDCVGVDISPKALDFARKNEEVNQVKLEWLESDLFDQVPSLWKGSFDAIVSNPPYIAKAEIETLMPEVRDFEPQNALDGGDDGLAFYQRIIRDSGHWLKTGGWLFFEIGYDQGEALLSMMEGAGFDQCTLRKDLAGLDRVVFGKLKENIDEV
ncbi:peptide chain release factor N(5)-glutamine methyltransferase [Anaerotignum propionicum]|uniref:peptide chain release factor N(5)-glutamine methyltransferase n=1 Tax=Anaerotignum propionicum TaxID=28446 RepID=UPI0021096F72|nr:peptide chain release factor N(5)-glutamine methyltransferase [Anaerotignum propionicum]MCQ4937495.1 peptide chain release factor N(5)-glutamine methyltransferase [Anaerotignum propionicum]